MEDRGRAAAVRLAAALLLIVAATALYLPVREHPFLDYDDNLYVTENSRVRAGLTRDGIAWAVTSTDYAGNWHPLTWVSHMLDVQLFGLAPGAHHLVNAAGHALNAALLFLLLSAATGAVPRSFVVAGLFAFHPLHVESVAWLSERKDVLSTFFGLLALAAYLRYARRPGIGRMIPVALSFALSLAAKPMLVTLPALLLLLDCWPLGRLRSGRPAGPAVRAAGPSLAPQSLILEKLPLIALSAATAFLTLLAQGRGGALDSLEGLPPAVRLATALTSTLGYLKLAVWPSPLAAIYPHPEALPAAGHLLLAAVACAGVTAAALFLARRRPWLAFGWFWYLVALLPVIGIVQVGVQAMADRYTYLTLTGPFLIVVWWAGGLRFRGRNAVLPAATIALFALLAWRSAGQIALWRDGVSLFRHTLAVTAGNFSAHNQLGVALGGEGRFEEAGAEFERAIAMRPRFSAPRYNLGLLRHRQGRLDEAANQYQLVLNAHPDFEPAHTNLGSILLGRGKHLEAASHFRIALELNPGDPTARQNLDLALRALAAGTGR
jgi:tetratricopeptide (TPR) repeat protein